MKRNVLHNYRRYTILAAIIFSCIGLSLDIIQQWGAINWDILHFSKGARLSSGLNPNLIRDSHLVIINLMNITIFIILAVLLLRKKISILLATVLYAASLTTNTFVSYVWYFSKTEFISAYILRDIILFHLIIFVVATCSNSFFALLFSIIASVFYILFAFLSGNNFLVENIPIIIMIIGSFAFVFSKIVILLERSIQRQEEEARQINELSRFKEKMSHMLLHDIKVPLSSIIMLSRNKPTEITSNSILYQASKAARMLGNIIDVESGKNIKIKLNTSDITLTELIEEVLGQVHYHALEKNITFNKQIPDNTIIIKGDRNLLERALINMIENGIKYSPENGSIDIHFYYKDETVKILISDQGPGIPDEEREKIFELFYTTQIKKDKIPSTGIGLTFCKMVIEEHGGNIVVDNKTKNGTTFIITLPGFDNPEIKRMDYNETINVISIDTLNILKPIVPRLKALDFYQTSEILFLLNSIDSIDNTDIQTELEEIKNAALSCNAKTFQNLINSIS